MEPAQRVDRLKAAVVDGLIMGLIYGLSYLTWAGWFALLVVGGIQWYLLTKHGQTLGKRLFKVRIVKADSLENGGFVRNVALRSMLNGLLCLIPFYFLVDALFIFRKDRRCLHDFIAGTIVVKTRARP